MIVKTSGTPVEVLIDSGRRIVRILPEGPATVEDMLETIPVFVHHDRFQPTMGRAWDLSKVDWEVTPEHVLRIFAESPRIPRHPHAGKTAVIVRPPLYSVLDREYPQYTQIRAGRIYRAFYGYFPAEAWLLAPLFTPDSRGNLIIPPDAEVIP